MKTMMKMKAIMLLAMISFFALNASAQKTDEAQILFNVKMTCKSCVKKIENHFGPMRGVKKVTCSIPNQTVDIVYSTKRLDEAKLIAEFKKIELDATPVLKESCTDTDKCSNKHE